MKHKDELVEPTSYTSSTIRFRRRVIFTVTLCSIPKTGENSLSRLDICWIRCNYAILFTTAFIYQHHAIEALSIVRVPISVDPQREFPTIAILVLHVFTL